MIRIGLSVANVRTKEPDPSEIYVASRVELLQYSRAAPQLTSSLISPFLPQHKLPSGGSVLCHELDGELFFFAWVRTSQWIKSFSIIEAVVPPRLRG